MSSPALPLFIECEQIHAGLAVSDMLVAVDWGKPPTFAGVNLGEVQMRPLLSIARVDVPVRLEKRLAALLQISPNTSA